MVEVHHGVVDVDVVEVGPQWGRFKHSLLFKTWDMMSLNLFDLEKNEPSWKSAEKLDFLGNGNENTLMTCNKI